MPFVHVQTIAGILSNDQKTEMLKRITDVMVEIEGRGDPSFRGSVWVKIDEHAPSNWSLGGLIPTAEMIAAKFPAID
ncbi:tautomerase family protein [Pararobbsia silviterrae]|uniref:4-oxalocrotonate tautomerase n=1 Tax=Pararobbsia silviterrae TaxID=1792498 RepID=A0A494XF82_9BURK|nr:tautomerase family protein [Pararobbsia silviterrae]RKP47146.1 4-oxalocrotonate tautomerase [Pararobbsia silviterrae]